MPNIYSRMAHDRQYSVLNQQQVLRLVTGELLGLEISEYQKDKVPLFPRQQDFLFSSKNPWYMGF